MDAKERRRAIEMALDESEMPLSATALAARFGVSRQLIVGDIALLRAAGAEIIATPRGYVTERAVTGEIRSTLACVHDDKGMERELNIMVDNGCTVLDVVIEHAIYGQLTGELRIKTRHDVREFIERVQSESAAPLSALTGGIHLHNVLCPDSAALERTKAELKSAGMLLED